jgi:hypothetical protein
MSCLRESITKAQVNLPQIYRYSGPDGQQYDEDSNLKDIFHIADSIRVTCVLYLETPYMKASLAAEIVEIVECIS